MSSQSWVTSGAKSRRRVFSDFPKTAHTAWDERKTNHPHTPTNTHTFTNTDLDHVQFIQPLVENGLDQREGLLQDSHHLRNAQNRCSFNRWLIQTCLLINNSWLEFECRTGLLLCGCVGTVFMTSSLSFCLFRSNVEKRLDSRPRMWTIGSLLAELGCREG